jgi:hypothetical protein
MKLTFSFLLMLFTLTGQAQVCIGCTEKEVYDWCKKHDFECAEQRSFDNQKYIVVSDPLGVCSHYFENELCFFGIFMPINEIALLAAIGTFNDLYVKISDTEWRDRLGTKEVVVLMKAKDNKVYFEFSTLDYYNKTKEK